MTPQEYLSQLIDIRKEIKCLDHGRRSLTSTILKGTQFQHDKSYSMEVSRPNENIVIKLEEFSEELEAKQKELIELLGTISKEIEKIPIRNHRLVLTYRYIYDMDFKDVSEKMNYSHRYTFDIHRNALKEFKKANPDKEWIQLQH